MENNTVEEPSPATSGQNEANTPSRGGKRPNKILPSPRLMVSKQLDVVRAFVNASQAADGAPVSNDDAATLVNMSKLTTVVSHPFLCDVGLLIRKGGLFEVSPTAKAYQQAYEWNPETAGQKLAPAFTDKWFARSLLPRLKMRDLSKQEAVQALAEAAGATKDYEENVAMLLEFMDISGIIKIEGNMVQSRGGVSYSSESTSSTPGASGTNPTPAAPPAQEGDICYLNKDRSRFVTVIAPLDISASEIARLKGWLDLMYFVAADDSGSNY